MMDGHIFPDINRPFASCPKPLFHNEAKCEAIDMKMIFILMQITVADPDLQIRGGAGLKTKFFWPFGPHFGLKIRRGPSPRSTSE